MSQLTFAQEADYSCLFDHTLIVGASVSQGVGAKAGGPSKIIAKAINPEAKVKVIAKHEKMSTESMVGYVEATPPSIVMGLDLFYWDAIKNQCDETFEAHTRNFFQKYQERNIPLIIGRLPKKISEPSGYSVLNLSECTDIINRMVDELCTMEKNCIIYDPGDCIRAMTKVKKGLGRKKYLNNLLKLYFVDDVHPSDAGNHFCAEHFLSKKSYQSLKCVKIDEHF